MPERLLKKDWFPLVTRSLSLLFFVLLMFALFYGSVEILFFSFTSRAAMLIVWTVWWPFLYLTVFFIARAWCGFLCPLSLAVEAGNYLRKGKTARILKWPFIPYTVFFLIVFLEQASGLFLSAGTTLAFFSIFFAASFIAGLLLPRFSFCRIFCPVGTILGLFSRLSFAGMRTDREKCRNCSTRECIRGTEKAGPCPVFINVPSNSTNRDCLLCTSCIKNCPHDSAKIRWRFPGNEITEKSGFMLGESLFIIALLGFTSILTTNGTMIFRKIPAFLGLNLKGAVLRGTDFVLALGTFILLYLAVSFIASKISGKPLKAGFVETGYAYLPLAFFIMAFSVIFGFLTPVFSFDETFTVLIKYIFILAGLAWSLALLFNLGRSLLEKILHTALLLAMALFWIFFLIPGPLAVSQPSETMLEVLPGEAVQMDAFSMGYTPFTLVAKKDVPVVINITNLDISHAFDIDEFNVHLIIVGGETARIQFTPDRAGEFKFYCSIPGHEEAGMKGRLIVRD